jgi:tetratricopeptide (TPR) repeat protein
MGDPEALREAGETARRGKDWQTGVEKYTELLELVYHENDDLSVQVCKDLVHYAECLIEADGDEDDRETAWECLENARIGYQKMDPDKVPETGLTDVYELLGEICKKNMDFEGCANQYKAASDIALSKPDLSWRIGLNSLYWYGLALEAAGKRNESATAFRRAIEFLDAERVKDNNARDLADMASIRADLVQKSLRAGV